MTALERVWQQHDTGQTQPPKWWVPLLVFGTLAVIAVVVVVGVAGGVR